MNCYPMARINKANSNKGIVMTITDKWRSYAERLPDIYRDILAAFPAIEPGRKKGYGLAFQTLTMHFINTSKQWSLGDVEAACKQLAENGFIEIKNGIFAHPTEDGEELIAAVTGKKIPDSRPIPALPARPA